MVLQAEGLLENEFAKDGITIRWVQSAGSNKALEFLNAGSIDFGSTAGAAALVGKINGNPIKSVYVYSRPEWTALVTQDDRSATVADLKGKRVAVTRGTDPHIFLVRALLGAGLPTKDVKLVLLQHADGKTALMRGDVDAWAGLDPLMAQAEVEAGAKLFYRKRGRQHLGHPQRARENSPRPSRHRPPRACSLTRTRANGRWPIRRAEATLVAVTNLPEAVVARSSRSAPICPTAVSATAGRHDHRRRQSPSTGWRSEVDVRRPGSLSTIRFRCRRIEPLRPSLLEGEGDRRTLQITGEKRSCYGHDRELRERTNPTRWPRCPRPRGCALCAPALGLILPVALAVAWELAVRHGYSTAG